MENASKALLIAAAVLIVILLIAFGVNIFNSAEQAGDAEGTANVIQSQIGAGTNKINELIGTSQFLN